MKKYFVSAMLDECSKPAKDFAVVVAKDEEEAKHIFAQNSAKLEDLSDEYYTAKAINLCFAEQFHYYNGKHIYEYNKDLPFDLINKAREENVRIFFAEKPEFAEIYIAEWNRESEQWEMDLPMELKEYMAYKDILAGKIQVIPLEELIIGG